MNGNQWLPGKVFKYIKICKTVKPPFRNSEKNVKYSCANTCTNTLVRTFLKEGFLLLFLCQFRHELSRRKCYSELLSFPKQSVITE